MAQRDPDEETQVARLEYQNGGASDTFHLLDKNNHVLCGAHQGKVNLHADGVVESAHIQYRAALDRDDVCRRCTGQAYLSRNG